MNQRLDDHQIATAVRLLRNSEITIQSIAQRLGCSRWPIIQINKRFKIRAEQVHRPSVRRIKPVKQLAGAA